jgi:hypothetical protein
MISEGFSADQAEGALLSGERPGGSRRSPGALEGFEVIWSGSMERAGLCAGLSRYEGNSSLGRNNGHSVSAAPGR